MNQVIEGVGSDYRRLEEIVNNAHQEGTRYVFLSGFEMNNALGNIFRRFNDMRFFVSSLDVSEPNVVTYTDKSYVAKYLAGYISGAFLSNSKKYDDNDRYSQYDDDLSASLSKSLHSGNVHNRSE